MKRWLPAVLAGGVALAAACDDTAAPGSNELLGEYTAVEADGGSLPIDWAPAVQLTGALLALGASPEQRFTLTYLLAVRDTTPPPPDSTGTPPDSTGTPPDSTGTPPDSTGTPPDSTGTPPDSTGTPPDTTSSGGLRAAAADSVSADTCEVLGDWAMSGDSLVAVDSTITVSGSGCGAEVGLGIAAGGTAILVQADAADAEEGPFHALRFERRIVDRLAAEPDTLLIAGLGQERSLHVVLADQAGVAYDVRTDLRIGLQGASVVELVESAAPDSLVLRSVLAGQAQLILLAGSRADTVRITVTR